MSATYYVVRKEGTNPKSETIAKQATFRKACDEARTFLLANGRDHEWFDMVVVDDQGQYVEHVETFEWEPRP